jgi:type I restriction enzyme S subunit
MGAGQKATPANETMGIDTPKDESPGLPERWVRMTLSQITLKMDSGWSPQCENIRRASTDEWAVLRTTAVQPMQFDFCEHKVLPGRVSPRPQYEAHRGEILITRAGPKNRLSVCCVVDRIEPCLMISDKLIRINLHDGICPHFVALSLNTGESQIAIEDAKSGMAVMQINISQDRLRAVPIPLPPLAEQRRIVAKVDELMALCDQLEASLASAATDRARLLEALLQEALAPAA